MRVADCGGGWTLVWEAQQAGDGDVLVELSPVNAGSRTDKPPVFPLLGSGVTQTRKPLERNGQRAPVLEVDDEGVRDEFDGPCASLLRTND